MAQLSLQENTHHLFQGVAQQTGELLDIVKVIRKRWAWILTCAFTSVVVAASWAWTTTPLYSATASIEVLSDGSADVDALRNGRTDDDMAFENHRHVLGSRPVLEGIAVSLKLADRPELVGSDPVAFLRGALQVERVARTSIFRLSARAKSPEFARELANAWAEEYIRAEVGRRVDNSKRMLTWLNEQIVDLKAQVEDSELALIKYSEQSQMAPRALGTDDAGDAAGGNLVGVLRSDLAKAELALAREKLDKMDAHPDVKKLAHEVKIIREKIADEERRLVAENKKEIRYEMLSREKDLNREMFALFMKQMKETDLIGENRVSKVQVLEYAAANANQEPVSPRKGRALGLGLLIGLLGGLGLAFLQEGLDRTLKTKEEVERAVGLPVISTIHHKPLAKGEERFLVKPDGSWGRELEDFRTLRTNLRFARAEGENRIIAVTSAVPQEGKTTVVTNLAAVMAQAGEKVLVIDCDLRRPAVHVALGMENNVGLTNYLAESNVDIMSIIRETSFPNLHVITAGAYAPNPPELLESAKMREALALWSKKYDRIMVDTPPVGSVVDPCIMAPYVDGVAMVVSTGRVEADRARAARQQLDNVGAKFFGVIVNQLRNSGEGYYGYRYYYSYSYDRYGYGDERRQEEEAKRRAQANG